MSSMHFCLTWSSESPLFFAFSEAMQLCSFWSLAAFVSEEDGASVVAGAGLVAASG
jgi:hypothetical protein